MSSTADARTAGLVHHFIPRMGSVSQPTERWEAETIHADTVVMSDCGLVGDPDKQGELHADEQRCANGR